MMWGIPSHWGFIRDLRQCEGKTIEKVEVVDLGFGYTIHNAWAVRFTDGTRAFFGNGPSKGSAVAPSQKWIKTSVIFTPAEAEEFAHMEEQKKQDRKAREEREQRRWYQLLKDKFEPIQESATIDDS